MDSYGEHQLGNTKHSASDHYHATAEVYNEYWTETHEAMVKIVLSKISLDKDDIVVDIGGGTGKLAHAIYKEAGLKRNVLCVDPSKSMLRLACQTEGISPLRGTAEEFFRNKENYAFDKALLVSCIHHFPETASMFKNWAQWLPPGSLCFILTRPPKTTLPFFRKALPLFEKSCADIPAMVECLRLLGLTVDVSEEISMLNMSKHRWYAMLRTKYMSNLDALTDQDIEEGIVELERERFFDKQGITVEDNITAIIVRKAQ